MISGISRSSRPFFRTQPQFRLDCSPAISPFSQSVTDSPLRQCQRGAGADDPAADDDDRRALW